MITTRRLALTALTALAALGGWLPAPAFAGCGCEKPPPVPAPIRPAVTYAGSEVTIFSSRFVAGKPYAVVFKSGTARVSAKVRAVAVSRRDLADGVVKVQLPVTVPVMPLGPTAITVKVGGQLLSITDADFTVAPAPVAIPAEKTTAVVSGYRAAVSRAGVVFVSLDLSRVTDPLIIRAQLRGYPLRFDGTEAVFRNTQGFLMQELDGAMPGLFTLSEAPDPADSDVLQYSRHEFNSYFLQHVERQPHQVVDGNWHADGTPHIDHDHLILALPATLAGGALPSPGATRASDFTIETYSLFSRAVTALGDVSLARTAFVAGYDSRSLASNLPGDVRSGGTLSMQDSASIAGTATAAAFDLRPSAEVNGSLFVCSEPVATMPVQIPAGIVDLGALALSKEESLELTGPASYAAASIHLAMGSSLYINNADGPVTLYVSGPVEIAKDASLTTAHPDAERFAVYVVGPGPVNVAKDGDLFGVFYAPDAAVTMAQDSVLYGAVVGGQVRVAEAGGVVHDAALQGPSGALPVDGAVLVK